MLEHGLVHSNQIQQGYFRSSTDSLLQIHTILLLPSEWQYHSATSHQCSISNVMKSTSLCSQFSNVFFHTMHVLFGEKTFWNCTVVWLVGIVFQFQIQILIAAGLPCGFAFNRYVFILSCYCTLLWVLYWKVTHWLCKWANKLNADLIRGKSMSTCIVLGRIKKLHLCQNLEVGEDSAAK